MTESIQTPSITTLIFDVDDTLYDVSTGFTAHRNGDAVQQFMVDRLGFADRASAKIVRDKYFARYHATAKGLAVAEQEGAFPEIVAGAAAATSPRFRPQDLSEYWATNLNFGLLGGAKTQMIKDLSECPLRIIAFSNGPRKYVIRVLQQLGLWVDDDGKGVISPDRLFAVDDVLPYCKPEPEAFAKIFEKIGARAEECVMVEDSMKNIRQAKALGMKTILISGAGVQVDTAVAAEASEATKPGDAPQQDDPAVDVALETVEQIRSALPGLWEASPAVFASSS